VRGQHHAPAAFYHRERPGTHCTAPGLVWTGAENLATTGNESPDHPASSQSLYRLSYPAHCIIHYTRINQGKSSFLCTFMSSAFSHSNQTHPLFLNFLMTYSHNMVKSQLNLPKKQNTVFKHKQLSFLFCTIRVQGTSCLVVYKVHCAKIQNFINNSFLSTRKGGSTLCKKGVNTFKTNRKPFIKSKQQNPNPKLQHISTLQYDWLKCNSLFY
jgi:hypothetical protein